MCVSDYRIAQQVRSNVLPQYNTTGAVNTSISRNPQRVAMMIRPDAVILGATAAILLTFDNGAIMTLATAGGLNMIKIEDIGELIQHAFVITAILTQHTGIVTEFTLPMTVLAANPGEFGRKL